MVKQRAHTSAYVVFEASSRFCWQSGITNRMISWGSHWERQRRKRQAAAARTNLSYQTTSGLAAAATAANRLLNMSRSGRAKEKLLFVNVFASLMLSNFSFLLLCGPLFPTLIYHLFAHIIFDRYLSNSYFYTFWWYVWCKATSFSCLCLVKICGVTCSFSSQFHIQIFCLSFIFFFEYWSCHCVCL